MTVPSPLPRRVWLPALLLILAVSLLPRLPRLYNAEHAFNSDEAANALVIRHLVRDGEFSFYNWGAHYYGIVEGVMAIPLTWIAGFTPLAFRLAAVSGFLLLVVFVFLLGRRVYGTAEGLAGAALVAVFSPQLVLWSTLASGGYTLMAAWGTLTLAHFAATRRRSGAGRIAVLGFLLGFGLYIYELYLVYVALLAGWALTASFVWKALLAPSRRERAAALALAPRQVRAVALCAAGFLVGWLPKLYTVLSGAEATKAPAYGLAALGKMRANLELLLTRSAPAFLGVNPARSSDLAPWVGSAGTAVTLLGLLVLVAWAAAWLWGAWRAAPEVAAVLRRPPGELGTESLLVLLAPLAALLFVLSPNPQDVLASRYLLPWTSALPVLAGAGLVRLWRWRNGVAVAMLALLLGYPALQVVRWNVETGYLTADLRLPRRESALRPVLRDLRRQGIRGGYGWYWIAYTATFLSDEEIVIAPSDGWDRYPAYTRFVDGLSDPAWLFEVGIASQQDAEAAFLALVQAAGKPYERRRIGPYAVYTSPRHERLLPAGRLLGPARLTRPRAEIRVLGLPATLEAGEMLAVPLRLTNAGEEAWQAAGWSGAAHLRVDVSYRWIDERGETVVLDGLRTALPRDVAPGATMEMTARVQVPDEAGSYRLLVTLVQEDAFWFSDVGGGAAVLPVAVAVNAAGKKAA